ncbi:MAG: hypothetical protein KGL39_51230 [Patescibacteria group bacterium]|nr:hypothetical protein [Patescibacteria group bacterium]
MRLSDHLRHTILSAAREKIAVPAKKLVDEHSNTLALAVVDCYLGDRVDQFIACPSGWFGTSCQVEWRLTNGTRRVAFLKERRALPEALCIGSAIITDAKIEETYQRLREEKLENDKALDQLNNKVRSILYSVNTIKQLLVAWPEVTQLVGNLKPKPIANLPAPSTDAINQILGLKHVEEKKSA